MEADFPFSTISPAPPALPTSPAFLYKPYIYVSHNLVGLKFEIADEDHPWHCPLIAWFYAILCTVAILVDR